MLHVHMIPVVLAEFVCLPSAVYSTCIQRVLNAYSTHSVHMRVYSGQSKRSALLVHMQLFTEPSACPISSWFKCSRLSQYCFRMLCLSVCNCGCQYTSRLWTIGHICAYLHTFCTMLHSVMHAPIQGVTVMSLWGCAYHIGSPTFSAPCTAVYMQTGSISRCTQLLMQVCTSMQVDLTQTSLQR